MIFGKSTFRRRKVDGRGKGEKPKGSRAQLSEDQDYNYGKGERYKNAGARDDSFSKTNAETAEGQTLFYRYNS